MINKPDSYWREKLDEVAYRVLRGGGTEVPYTGKFYLNTDKGMYTCGACGVELFSSENKYDAGCGWPSFWEAADEKKIELLEDTSLGMVRTEVRCKNCGSHLGHLFDDGPQPSGKRFCINSASLGFKKQ